MAKFLTQEWLDVAREALGSSDDVKNAIKGVDISILQVITGAPGGDTSYWSKFDDGTITSGIGDMEADVTISQDYETAEALNKGELNAQAAFMQGKLKVTGNMGKLLQHQGVMSEVAKVLATVPTEY